MEYVPTLSSKISGEVRDADAKKKLRTQIKAINFGLAYGMGPFKLSRYATDI